MKLTFEVSGNGERTEHSFVKSGDTVRWIQRDYHWNHPDGEEVLVFETRHDFALADDGATVEFNGTNWRVWGRERAKRTAEIRELDGPRVVADTAE